MRRRLATIVMGVGILGINSLVQAQDRDVVVPLSEFEFEIASVELVSEVGGRQGPPRFVVFSRSREFGPYLLVTLKGQAPDHADRFVLDADQFEVMFQNGRETGSVRSPTGVRYGAFWSEGVMKINDPAEMTIYVLFRVPDDLHTFFIQYPGFVPGEIPLSFPD